MDRAAESHKVTTDLVTSQLATGSQTRQSRQFAELLRLRVAVVQSLAVAIWGTIWILGVTGLDPLYSSDAIGRRGLVTIGIVVAYWICGSATVWLRSDWSVRTLRLLEFGILVPHAALLLLARRLQFGEAETARGIDFLLASTCHNGFGWLAALVAWGLVFPHPRSRMIAINSILVACPLATDAAIAAGGVLATERLLLPIIITAEMLLFGFVTSLFSSQRIASLQAEVADAHERIREAKELGPYELKQLLGAGGMGEVYLAEHRLLKRPCAVKLIRADRAGDRLALARFEREAQATARLKHPNTVDVFDFGRTEDGTFYYVMELLDGLSLDQVVKKTGPLPEARVVHVLKQLCGALREAHQAGLVHRDIKPSNVLLCRLGGVFDVVKLVDFGLVVSEATGSDASHITQAGSITGTPDFISPEQADGTGADQRSDLYSLGATAYFLLSGRPPFPGRTVLDILFAHRHQSLPPLRDRVPGISAGVEAIVNTLLEKDPAHRFPTAEVVEEALRRCSAEAWRDEDAERWWRSQEPPTDG
ncbi:MAG: serine/threonine-protein kinase [Gemmataceae bacterium]